MSATASIFTKVVCGVDASPAGLEAVKQAQRLAPAGADLTLISVAESHLAVHAGPSAAEWAKRLHDEAKAALDEAQATAQGAKTILLHGRAGDAFLRAVGDQDATLAAVGSHEIPRGIGILIGSVGTRVLHEARCSVLVARPAEWPWPRSIVVGVDGSTGSLAALAVAHEIAGRLGAAVRLVVARGASSDDVAAGDFGTLGYEVAVSDEKPVPALLDAARDADLLLVGSRGVTGLRTLGSVSERVAHHAPCSLLVVRGVGA
jgi:nucleotide-binding universal stress UspA family protein